LFQSVSVTLSSAYVVLPQVIQSPTHAVLRTAVVSTVSSGSSGTSLQPQRPGCITPLNKSRPLGRYSELNADTELPGFLQERLEDGNARRVGLDVVVC
jgi:hypothetical protein